MDHETVGKLKALAFLEDFKARVKLEQIVAAAGPTPSPADEELEEWLDLWGEEIAKGLQEALRLALAEVEPNENQDRGSLTSSAEIIDALFAAARQPERIPIYCLSKKQADLVHKQLRGWIKGNIEESLEGIVIDTFHNSARNAGLDTIRTTWGVHAPDDIYSPQDLQAELETRSAEARVLTEAERRIALEKANKDEEYWSEQVSHYQGIVDRDEFENEESRQYARSFLRRARELAGLDFDPAIDRDSPGYQIYNFDENGRFYYTRANRIISEEQKILNDKLEEIERDIKKRDRQLKALDQKNLKDYNKLDNVFQFGHYGGRGYTYYRRARYWRELQREGKPGGFRRVTTTEAPLSSVADDVTTLFSKAKSIGDSDRALASSRIERFLRANVPEPTDLKIKTLMRDKHFLQALANPAILATEIKSDGVGLRSLTGAQMRAITDRGADLAHLTIPNVIKRVDDLICSGVSFGDAVSQMYDHLLRIGKDVSNSVMNDTLDQIAADPYLNSPDVDPPAKVWVTALVNSRKAHIDANGQRRALDANFNVGGEQAPRPLSMQFSAKNTANCRCRMKVEAFLPNGEPVTISLVDSQFFG